MPTARLILPASQHRASVLPPPFPLQESKPIGTKSIWHWLIVLFGTKKIKNIGTDLGAAIKGFKEGVREGTAETPAAGNPSAANPPGVTNSTAQADPNTIDVEAKTKS